MLFDSMQATHSQLTHPAELIWLVLWGAGGTRDLSTVLQIDRLPDCAFTKKERQQKNNNSIHIFNFND